MLAHERIGSGEPVVLLHGIAHRRQAWYPLVELLAPHRELILVDLPGHGESPKLRGAGLHPGKAILEELRQFIKELGVGKPHVVGNSIGGRFALELGEVGAVRSVTALSPGGFWYGPADFAYTLSLFGAVMGVATVLSPFARMLTRSELGRMLLFFWIHHHPTRLDPDRAYGDFRALLRARPTLLRFITEYPPCRPGISKNIPVSIAWADLDMVLPRYQSHVAKRELPDARHMMLRRCGHVPMTDDPETVAAFILQGTRSPGRPV
ncbi:alpha/beta fold hydrolase [Actinocorallia lasiicapitis]